MAKKTIECIVDKIVVAPFGFKTVKCKKGDVIVADADNAEVWIKDKKFKASSEDPKNAEPEKDNTAEATAKAEKAQAKAKGKKG